MTSKREMCCSVARVHPPLMNEYPLRRSVALRQQAHLITAAAAERKHNQRERARLWWRQSHRCLLVLRLQLPAAHPLHSVHVCRAKKVVLDRTWKARNRNPKRNKHRGATHSRAGSVCRQNASEPALTSARTERGKRVAGNGTAPPAAVGVACDTDVGVGVDAPALPLATGADTAASRADTGAEW